MNMCVYIFIYVYVYVYVDVYVDVYVYIDFHIRQTIFRGCSCQLFRPPPMSCKPLTILVVTGKADEQMNTASLIARVLPPYSNSL